MTRILLSGGGTGGHITPLLAVAHELKQLQPDCHITFVGEKNGKYAHFTDDNPDIDQVVTIFAGKFRRYHNESWLKRVFDVKTNLLNVRDALYFAVGTLQSLVKIRRLKPDMILLKGGFVGVPVGLAAAFWRKTFVTHDSDTVPGLANRLVGRWAKLHATAMPADYYPYKLNQVRHVGVLVGPDYKEVDQKAKIAFREQLGLQDWKKIVVVTGGSGGAGKINQAVHDILPRLFEETNDVYVIHQVGAGKGNVYSDIQSNRVQVQELLKPMYVYTGAADVVISRAGANTLAELGVQGRACIVVPNPMLTGGHQIKNGQYLEQNQAAIVLDEKSVARDANTLYEVLHLLLTDEEKLKKLADNLQKITITDAASRLAKILLGKDL